MSERETDYNQFSRRVRSDTRSPRERSVQLSHDRRLPPDGSEELSRWVELIQIYRNVLEDAGVEFRGRNVVVGELVKKGVGATGVVEIVESVAKSR